MLALLATLAFPLAPVVSAAPGWWRIRQGESLLRLVVCYQKDEDSDDGGHFVCGLSLETPRLGPLDTCHTTWFFDPDVTGEVTTEANHYLGSRAWGEFCGLTFTILQLLQAFWRLGGLQTGRPTHSHVTVL